MTRTCPKCGATLVVGLAGGGPSCPNLCTLAAPVEETAPLRVFHEAVVEAMPLKAKPAGPAAAEPQKPAAAEPQKPAAAELHPQVSPGMAPAIEPKK